MSYQHIKIVDFDGVSYEVLVLKEDAVNGDLYFIRTDFLDQIDRSRLRTILSKRDADKYPLWDLLDQRTLPNGVNGLEYFHQYVKVRAANGKVFNPQPGRMGTPVRKPQPAAATKKTTKATEAASEEKSE